MKKRILFIFVIMFAILCLLPGGAAFAVTFGFDTEETAYDNVFTDSNSGYSLQIISDNSSDFITNYSMDTTKAGAVNYAVVNTQGYVLCVTGNDGNSKPAGTVTVSLVGGGCFSLNGFYCGNGGGTDNLTITAGSTTDTFSVAGAQEAHIVPNSAAAFQGITSFTIDWAENPVNGIINPHCMYFDKFDISFNPVIKTQPSDASVSKGGNTSYTVAAIGSALTYQWQVDTGSGSFTNILNGGAYSNADTSTLNISGATFGMNHYLYRCAVTSNATDTTYSNSAKLTILAQAPTDITLTNASIDENTASGTKVGGFTSTDADTTDPSSFTYSLVDTATYPDNNSFTISGSNLLLNMVPNHEAKSSDTICVQTQDDTGLTFKKTFNITIADVNEKPTDITLSNASVAENSTPGTQIGILTGIDPDDGDSLSYSLPVATDRANFLLSGNSLQIGMSPNYEGIKTYYVTVRVSDGVAADSYYDKTFTISITNVNETQIEITLDSNPIDPATNFPIIIEHSPVGTEVATISAEDLDGVDTLTFELVSGTGSTDNSWFTIVGNKLKLNKEPDYETKSPDYTYKIRIKSSDDEGLNYEQAFTIAVTDGNDPPSDITLTGGSIAENSAPNSSVGALASTDNEGDTFTYSFAVGAGDTDNAGFSLTGNTLTIKISADYETKSSYSIRIRSTDNHGLYFEKALTISITNVNEAPTDMALTKNTIAENSAIGTPVGTLSGTDPDAGTTLTFTLVPASLDNASFTISEGSLNLSVKPDFETKNTYSILVRESDGALTFDKLFTIHIIDAGDAPTDISISASTVLEHCAVNTVIGSFSSTDQDADQLPDDFDYTLVAGTGAIDNASFSISADTLKITVSPDFEVKPSYSIRVRTTDAGGLCYEKVFTINITDGGDPPTNISLSNQSIAENSPVGTVIGTLSTTDSNAGDFTYTFVTGSGDTDNGFCKIEDNALKLTAAPNYETKSSYSIRIRTTNNSTHFYFDKVFTITITDVNEAPTGINLSSNNITEHVSSGTTVATISGIDPDAGSTFTYALTAGTGDTDNASFTIVNNELRIAEEPDYEVKPTYNIRIKVTDNGSPSLTYEKDLILIVVNGNDPPTDLSMLSDSIKENTSAGTKFTKFNCTDANGGTMTFSLVEGSGSTDNDKFTFSGDELSMQVVPDYETKASYNIRARVTDSGGLYYEKALVITVEDMNDAPTDLQLTGTKIAENMPIGTNVGTLSGTDQDAGDTFTYSLASGTGDTDNSSFAITGDKLQTAASFNYEAKNSYSVRVRIRDNNGLLFEKQLTISVEDGNDAPTDISLFGTNIEENSAVGTSIGTLSGIDQDAGDTFTYAFAAGAGDSDNSSFTISGNTLKLAVVPDYETKAIYDIRIRITDRGSLTFERRFVISIIDGNDAPTDIILSTDSIDENTAVGVTVADISSTDLDSASFTYTLVSGTGSTDNSSFSISGSELKLAFEPDYESKSEYSIRIRTTDNGGLSFEKAFVITINDVNEAPTDITISGNHIAENSTVGTAVGTLSGTDPDAGSTLIYSLVSGTGDTDNTSFTITGNKLQAATTYDYEAKSSYSIRIQVMDAGSLSYEKQFTISVDDNNEAPTDIGLSGTSIAENSAIGTVIGTLSGTDPDAGSSFTYSLVAGAGDTDNNSCVIVGNKLKLAAVPDYEAKSGYDIRIKVTDNGSLTFEKHFTITITDGKDAPTNIILSADKVDENSALDTTVATISSTDIDSSSFRYSLVPGVGSTDNACFTISGNELKLAVVPDYEVKTNYHIRIRSTDESDLSYEKAFTISINDLYDTSVITPPTPPQNPTPEKITLDVTNGTTDDSVAEIELERTTQSDGTVTDSVNLGEVKTKETIEKLEEKNADTLRINIPIAEKTNEVEVTIPTESLNLLSGTDLSMELETEAARISIPNSSLETANKELVKDLFFKVNPVTDEEEQKNLSERASQNGMLVQMLGEDFSVIGTPMEIKTNMPQTPVDVILPVTGIVVPEDKKARAELLSKLAVYVEHSDGDKEVIRGEIVEYSEGVYGLKFSVSKFSTFTIIKDESTKSNQCSILSVKSPAGTSGNGTMLRSKVQYKTASVKIKITVSEGATWKIYSDKACTKKISSKIKLKKVTTKVYVKVTAEDGVSYKIYTLDITRSKAVPVN